LSPEIDAESSSESEVEQDLDAILNLFHRTFFNLSHSPDESDFAKGTDCLAFNETPFRHSSFRWTDFNMQWDALRDG